MIDDSTLTPVRSAGAPHVTDFLFAASCLDFAELFEGFVEPVRETMTMHAERGKEGDQGLGTWAWGASVL